MSTTTTRPPFDGRVNNSTLRRHSEMRPRSGKLVKGGAWAKLKAARRTKGLRKQGDPAKQSKQHARYDAGLRRYHRTETARLVTERAGGRCECGSPHMPVPWRTTRCEYEGPLQHHHKTNARFGGKELPEDMAAVSPTCHDRIEDWFYPHRRPRRHSR